MNTRPIAKSCGRAKRRAGLVIGVLSAFALGCAADVASAQDALPTKPGQLVETRPPAALPTELPLTDLNEQPATLPAAGHPLLVNLWATWCTPCLREMPSLAKFASAFKDQGLSVVAISEDLGGKFQVDPYLQQHPVPGLTVLLDKTANAMKTMKIRVLPVTLIVDAQGHEIGRVIGDRDWDTPESRTELAGLLGLKQP